MESKSYSCTRKLDDKLTSVLYLELAGKIGGFAVPEFEKTLLDNLGNDEFTTVILDCGDITYITSEGLRSFLKAIQTAGKRKIDLVCRCLPESFFWSILTQVGLHKYVTRWDPMKMK